jgi:hypothetical protein
LRAGIVRRSRRARHEIEDLKMHTRSLVGIEVRHESVAESVGVKEG